MSTPTATAPLVQIAIDEVDFAKAAMLAEQSIAAGADWLEVGKPFIEFNGLRGAERLIARHPERYWLLDLMVMAAPRRYIEAAAQIGAANVTVTALAPDITLRESAELGRAHGVDITFDLFNTPDVRAAVQRLAPMGPAYLMVHFGIDQKRAAPHGSPIADLQAAVAASQIPVSYATYDIEEALAARGAGAAVIVQGEPLLSDPDPGSALLNFIANTKAGKDHTA